MTRLLEVRGALYGSRLRERRFITAASVPFQIVRDADGETPKGLRGYASVTDAPYTIRDYLGEYTETVARGAFAKALRENDDVRLLVNHDGIPLARTASATMALREVTNPNDDPFGKGMTGLWVEVQELDSASPLVQTVRSAMERGDLAEMSFAFRVTRQEWNGEYTERIIREVQLFDVSVVTYPANPATDVQLNSGDVAGLMAQLEAGQRLDDEQLDTVRNALAIADATGALEVEDDTEEMQRRERALALALARQ